MRESLKLAIWPVVVLSAFAVAILYTPDEPHAAQVPAGDLFARLTATDGTKIPVHALSAGLGEVAAGNLQLPDVYNALNLGAAAQADCQAIANKYLSFGTTTAGEINKAKYLWQIERVFILVEAGFYNEQKARTCLDFPGT